LLLQEIPLVAPNPNLCTDFVEMQKGDKLLLQQQQYLSKLFTKRPKLVDSQQGERTVPQGKLTVLHSPSSPTQNTTKKKNIGTVFGLIFCAFKNTMLVEDPRN